MIYALELAGADKKFNFRFFFEHDGPITYHQVFKQVRPQLLNAPYKGAFGGMDEDNDKERLKNLEEINDEHFNQINEKNVVSVGDRYWQLYKIIPVPLEG